MFKILFVERQGRRFFQARSNTAANCPAILSRRTAGRAEIAALARSGARRIAGQLVEAGGKSGIGLDQEARFCRHDIIGPVSSHGDTLAVHKLRLAARLADSFEDAGEKKDVAWRISSPSRSAERCPRKERLLQPSCLREVTAAFSVSPLPASLNRSGAIGQRCRIMRSTRLRG